MKEKLLFEIIVTRQCNKRCPYCDLDFSSEYISEDVIDSTILYFSRIQEEVSRLTINFFGGEPLLAFPKIEYFIHKLKEKKVISKLSIGTNGLLLDVDKLLFFRNNDFNIYLSIDTETGIEALEKNKFKDITSMFEINFILNPKTLYKSYDLLSKVIEKGFTNINIMPVFGTMKWHKQDLIELKKFFSFCYIQPENIEFTYYSYFNGVAVDKQFIIEIDGKIYSDIDSLLWLQRQNHTSVSQELQDSIYSETYMGSILSLSSLKELLDMYNIKKILRLVFRIPRSQGLSTTYKLIDYIIKKG